MHKKYTSLNRVYCTQLYIEKQFNTIIINLFLVLPSQTYFSSGKLIYNKKYENILLQ